MAVRIEIKVTKFRQREWSLIQQSTFGEALLMRSLFFNNRCEHKYERFRVYSSRCAEMQPDVFKGSQGAPSTLTRALPGRHLRDRQMSITKQLVYLLSTVLKALDVVRFRDPCGKATSPRLSEQGPLVKAKVGVLVDEEHDFVRRKTLFKKNPRCGHFV